jgi:hypothetical protein
MGRTETDLDYVTIASVHRLSATLDRAKLWVVDDHEAVALSAEA